ncbi:MAG: NAD(P)-binding protein, partial [Woeseiaceae bacterium]|nr:NAD(P)-binding protein [Woeseiaceae bacterium]
MQRLAVIGGGVSGVCLAHLVQEQYDITLFEAQDYLGGNNCSIEVEGGSRVPMGVIIYPARELFEHTQAFADKFGLQRKPAHLAHIFCSNDEVRYRSYSGSGHFLRDIKDVAYLNYGFKAETESHDRKLGDLVAGNKLSKEFVDYVLAPFAALYLSVPYAAIFELPLSTVAGWWNKYCHPFHLMSSFNYIDGGNHQLIDRFAENTRMKIRLNTAVSKVSRSDGQVLLQLDNDEERFDKLVFATRPDEALAMLDSPTATENQLLGNIETNTLTSTLHRQPYGCLDGDITLNMYGDDRASTHMVTTWGNRKCFGMDLPEEIYTSLHQVDKEPVDDSDILAQRTFKVPVQMASTWRVSDRLDELNSDSDAIYYCGSYFCPSYYHEDGIDSAMSLAG